MKTEWAHEFHYLCRAAAAPALGQELNLLAAAVFRVTDCRDVARGLPVGRGRRRPALHPGVNPLPGLYPGWYSLVLEAAADDDIGYGTLINSILDAARARYGL